MEGALHGPNAAGTTSASTGAATGVAGLSSSSSSRCPPSEKVQGRRVRKGAVSSLSGGRFARRHQELELLETRKSSRDSWYLRPLHSVQYGHPRASSPSAETIVCKGVAPTFPLQNLLHSPPYAGDHIRDSHGDRWSHSQHAPVVLPQKLLVCTEGMRVQWVQEPSKSASLGRTRPRCVPWRNSAEPADHSERGLCPATARLAVVPGGPSRRSTVHTRSPAWCPC